MDLPTEFLCSRVKSTAWAAVCLFLALCSGFCLANDPDSVSLITGAAERGTDASQVLLAIAYLNGDGQIARDPVKAVYWFERAAIQGNAYAEERLGDLYGKGIGVERNQKLAFDWRIKAAKRGSLDAQVKIGSMYQDGIGVVKDIDQAIYWFRRAAADGSVEAQSLLARLDHFSADKELDQAGGRSWFEIAAKRGYEIARYFIDLLEDARYWIDEDWHHRLPGLEKVARDGDLEAAFQLGRRYEHGIGGAKHDNAIAIAWYLRAAEGGHTGAMHALAEIYGNGIAGVARNRTEAARWAGRAQMAVTGTRTAGSTQ